MAGTSEGDELDGRLLKYRREAKHVRAGGEVVQGHGGGEAKAKSGIEKSCGITELITQRVYHDSSVFVNLDVCVPFLINKNNNWQFISTENNCVKIF